jgi:hypothetical protein
MGDLEPVAPRTEEARQSPSRASHGFQLGPIRVDVNGRAAHEAEDTWDATWLSVTATCAVAGARVVVPDTVVTSWSVERFCGALDVLARTGVGCAYLAAEAPNLTIRVEARQPDAPIMARVELTVDCAGQGHWFAFPIDRTGLAVAIARCREILQAYPTHQVADHD